MTPQHEHLVWFELNWSYITHSGLCWILLAIFRYGLLCCLYISFILGTLKEIYWINVCLIFMLFSVTFEHKNQKNNHIFWGQVSVYVSDLGVQRTFFHADLSTLLEQNRWQIYRAATWSRMLEYPHGWQLLGYDFSYPNIRLQKKKKNLSRPTLTRAWVSGGRWHGAVGKNVSQLKHCQTHHSETGTKCLDFCLDLEENGLFCHLWFLKQHCLLLLLLLNRRLQLQLEVKLHALSATELGYCSIGMVVAKKKFKKKNQKIQKKFKKIIKKHGLRIF